jgi:Domain of unknown function (DUF1963)
MLVEALIFVLVAGAIFVAMVGARSRVRGAMTNPAAEPDLLTPMLPVLPPPPRQDDPRKLRASRDQAILLRRHFPPRPGDLSHWGGVPLAPLGFTWPFFADETGQDRALHHVLQLSCADIPEEARLGLMPDMGQLYVFLDLDWGTHWKWSVRYETGEPSALVPAPVPASLPRAYAHRDTWGWARRDEDWPRLLPFWSIDPLHLTGGLSAAPVDEDGETEHDFWPGTIPLARRLEAIDGAIVPTHYYENRYESGALVRPFANYPHDWQAVRIAMGHAARQAERGHLDRYVKRGDLLEVEAVNRLASMREAIARWSARADAEEPFDALTPTESDAVWQFFLDHQEVALFGLSEAVNDAVDCTLSGNPDAARVLPAEALDLVRGHHALANRNEDGKLHIYDNIGRMLCPPSFVQGDAEERIGEWLLLLELADTRPLGHHLAEGVFQFWIRPADLAARRFDLVELTASAY